MEAAFKAAPDILTHSLIDWWVLNTSHVSVIVLRPGDPMVRASLEKENKLSKNEEHD